MRSLLRLFACAAVSTAAAEPLFETTRVFDATPNNKPSYRIPAILQARNGDVLIFAERRNDGPGDVGDHDIALKRSGDLGKTWSAEQMIFDDEKRICTDLTVGIDRSNGKIWLFFLRDKKRFAFGDRWEELSPAHQVRPGVPPAIVFHGTADTTTPYKGAQLFLEAMQRAGNRCELVTVEGSGHTYMFKDLALYAETLQKVDAFLASLGFVPSAINPQ